MPRAQGFKILCPDTLIGVNEKDLSSAQKKLGNEPE